jgi:hypothetical protein
MPGPKRHSKLTGDIHPPELDEGSAASPDEETSGTAAEGDAGRPGRDENAAGFVNDKDLGGRGGTER